MGLNPIEFLEESLTSLSKMGRRWKERRDAKKAEGEKEDVSVANVGISTALAFGGKASDVGFAPYGAKEIARRANVKISSIRDFLDVKKFKSKKKMDQVAEQWEKMYGAVFTLGDKKHPGPQIIMPQRYLDDERPTWGQFAITSHEVGHASMFNKIPKALQTPAMIFASPVASNWGAYLGIAAFVWDRNWPGTTIGGKSFKRTKNLLEFHQPKFKTFDTKLVNGVFESKGPNVLADLFTAAKASNFYKAAAQKLSKIEIPKITPKSLGKFGARLAILGAGTMLASESFANIYAAGKMREVGAPSKAYEALAGSEVSYAGAAISMAGGAMNLYGALSNNSAMGSFGLMGWIGGMAISSIGQNMVRNASKPIHKIVGHHPGWANKKNEESIRSDFKAGHSYSPRPGSPGHFASMSVNELKRELGVKYNRHLAFDFFAAERGLSSFKDVTGEAGSSSFKKAFTRVMDKISNWVMPPAVSVSEVGPFIGNLKSSGFRHFKGGSGFNYLKTVMFHEASEFKFQNLADRIAAYRWQDYASHITPRVLFDEARFIGELGDKGLYSKFRKTRVAEAARNIGKRWPKEKTQKILSIYEKQFQRGLKSFESRNIGGFAMKTASKSGLFARISNWGKKSILPLAISGAILAGGPAVVHAKDVGVEAGRKIKFYGSNAVRNQSIINLSDTVVSLTDATNRSAVSKQLQRTAIHESGGMRFAFPLGKNPGPDRGIFQIQPRTAFDVLDRIASRNKNISSALEKASGKSLKDLRGMWDWQMDLMLRENNLFSGVIARGVYTLDSAKFPKVNSELSEAAAFWGLGYNKSPSKLQATRRANFIKSNLAFNPVLKANAEKIGSKAGNATIKARKMIRKAAKLISK